MTENYEFANMKTEREFNKTMMNLYAFLFWDAYRFLFLETEQAIFFPVFGVDTDSKAIDTAQNIFNKTIVPVNINEIAKQSGVLNCISWEI